jgi:hypothetical protein
MKLLNIFVILFLLGVVISPGIGAEAAPGNSNSIVNVSAASTDISHADLIAFVDNAVAYAKANGKETAIKEFNTLTPRIWGIENTPHR